jgi:hypothetical protein
VKLIRKLSHSHLKFISRSGMFRTNWVLRSPCGGGVLFRASGDDCRLRCRRVRGLARRPPPVPRLLRALFTHAPRRSAVQLRAGERARDATRAAPDELQRAEEGGCLCVRECARAYRARALSMFAYAPSRLDSRR